jgi:equilibrative nucleoside transporter 1/2/3
MFLAANPYFKLRFETNSKILSNFQAAETSVSCAINFIVMIILMNVQGSWFPFSRRVTLSLVINIFVFTFMTISTRAFKEVTAAGYFIFLLIMILMSSIATALMQNGIFAYMAGFGRNEYAQGNMVGQAISGVLPCLVQIISVLSLPEVESIDEKHHQASKSALRYFAAAVGVTVFALIAWLYLVALDKKRPQYHGAIRKPSTASAATETSAPATKRLSLGRLILKLWAPAITVFLTFAIAMFFPVFTGKILSNRTEDPRRPRILGPECFIPLAFLVWNIGDLIGRSVCALPQVKISQYPRILTILGVLRAGLIPLYFLCNIDGKGAVVSSDLFYLGFIQLIYGMTNGYIGTQCMMGAPEYVEVEHREQAGAFMPVMLVAGLVTGSFLSFAIP